MALFTPINQKRLTNVSVVRLKRNGNRYELACYPNKVKAWREKLERNIDEVLQAHEIFSNVSKGQLATKSDLFRDFDTEDVDTIIRSVLFIVLISSGQILNDGEMQVTVKERKVENENLFRDVAKIVSERCFNPENSRAYTVTMIEKMMKDCHVNLQPKKSAKQQALEVIRQLRASGNFKIAPAMMEILISLDPKLADNVSPRILKLVHHIIRQERNPEGIFELSAVIEPENYHSLTVVLDEHAKDRYCIEIIGVARPVSGVKKPPLPSPLSSAVVSTAPILETSPISEEPSDGSPTPAPDGASQRCTADPATPVGGGDDNDRCGTVSRGNNQTKKRRRRRNRKVYDDDDVEDDSIDGAVVQKEAAT
ncbi:ribosome maturation protein sbds [Echinococcus multilocularis]|uniref:Ribosome maturation protein SBDS n=1 Tax=Echinococcus multilocularis TaxID=6211 RepID=A0A068Y6U8_ECHMU|nr:ribosome maturation protein sbds [Echinococcus multilocularis]